MNVAITFPTSSSRVRPNLYFTKLFAATVYVIISLLVLLVLYGGGNQVAEGKQSTEVTSAQAGTAAEGDRALKVQDLPPEAQEALRTYFDGVFIKTPAGHHVSTGSSNLAIDYPGIGWVFSGSGDEIWANLHVHYKDKIRLANLRYQVFKRRLTIADNMNKRTKKFLIVVQADAVQKLGSDSSTSTAWYDTSKGLSFRKAYLECNQSGSWNVSSLIKFHWNKPDESYDISNL